MILLEKAKLWMQKYKLAKAYVNAIHALPPNYQTSGGINALCEDLNMKQIFPDPESHETIKRKMEAAKKAEKEWIDFCQKNNL